MNKRLKKSIVIILVLVALVTVVSATAIFFIKQRDKKYNHIEKINLQSYAGNNVLSESAFDYQYDTIEWGPANLTNILQYEEALLPAIKYPTKNEIYTMLVEEAEPYWSGNKSAKECMDTLNSRVSIYIKERE